MLQILLYAIILHVCTVLWSMTSTQKSQDTRRSNYLIVVVVDITPKLTSPAGSSTCSVSHQVLLRGSCTPTQPVAGGRNAVLTLLRTPAWLSPLLKQVSPLMEQPVSHHITSQVGFIHPAITFPVKCYEYIYYLFIFNGWMWDALSC